jgi:quercetin dioxygenase-like cupin family protein
MSDSAAVPDSAITRRSLMEAFAALLLSAGAAETAQSRPSTAKPVFQHDLPELMLKGWAVTAVEVSYEPGQSSPAHRHPGITIAYVLEGEIRSKVGDQPERTYRVGEMFFEAPEELHAVSGNASSTRPARLLAVLLAEKGKPLTTPAK